MDSNQKMNSRKFQLPGREPGKQEVNVNIENKIIISNVNIENKIIILNVNRENKISILITNIEKK